MTEHGDADATRRARIETAHGDRETATTLALALRPDNTAEMDTRVEGSRVVTTIARESTGSLQSTADDYALNLRTAARVAAGRRSRADRDDNHNTDSDGATTDSNNTETDHE